MALGYMGTDGIRLMDTDSIGLYRFAGDVRSLGCRLCTVTWVQIALAYMNKLVVLGFMGSYIIGLYE